VIERVDRVKTLEFELWLCSTNKEVMLKCDEVSYYVAAYKYWKQPAFLHRYSDVFLKVEFILTVDDNNNRMWATFVRCYQNKIIFSLTFYLLAQLDKSFVWAHYQSQISVSYRRTVYLLLELLFVKFGSLSVSCLSQADITYAIDSICVSWCVMFLCLCHICTLCTIFIIN